MNYLLANDMIILVINMARKPRIHYPGALYHVMVRGNNGENVLSEEIHKNKYLDIIASYKDKISFILYAHCIMDNHAHLLIEVTDVPLSQIMQRIQQVYTQWFNRKYNRTGHVFQQRYKALLCDKDNYLLQLIRYIHNNPVKAGLEGGIEYKWSSHVHYIGKKSDIVDTSDALSIFAENKNKAVRQYLQFMSQGDTEIVYVDKDELQRTNLTKKIKKKELIENINIDEIIEAVCINENITISNVTRKTRIQKIADIRKAIVLLSEDHCNASNKLLSQKLNLSSSMISKIRSGDSEGSAYVKEVIRRWEEVSK
ncbi:transposase [Anaerovirgula multivorans]|uniref:transposase n=1 Tax=Anaerovirgula multivorans TaxID=312168 RepID=UPI0015957701|nr:transposase [Anaerovirgula multivorans]